MTQRLVPLAAALALALGSAPAAEAATLPDVNTVLDITFPVAGTSRSYSDTFEASRGGGRLHMSTDIMAARGTPVHAAVGGTITWITGLDGNPPSYGYMISIRGDDGLDHGYVHLGTQDGPPSAAYAAGMARGVRVERGQLIGFVGNSGCGCVDHLHYDIEDPRYPSENDHYDHFRYNPYPSLRAAEERGDVPATAAPEPRPVAPAPEGTPLSGDWDGDGRTDTGWYHRGNVALRMTDGSVVRFRYGVESDVPIVGDFDGDGDDSVSVIRDGEWHINNRLTGGPAERVFVYGRVLRGDVPITGDWNGDGTDEIGIIRDGQWHLRWTQSGGPADKVFVYGRILRGDVPIIGDWDGNGRDDVGIVRDGEWHLRFSLSGGAAEHTFVFGRVLRGDVPVIGDWDGNGKDDAGIVRTDTWHLRNRLLGGSADSTFVFNG